MDNFLDNYCIVNSFSPRDKSGLERRYQIWKKRPNPSNNDLGDGLVYHVTQTNGAIMNKSFWITTFRDQSNNRSVEVLGNPTEGKNLLYFIPN